MQPDRQHTIVIVGAGSAGTSTAGRLHRAGARDVAIIDPWEMHYYQPLWTLVGGGRAKQAASARPREQVMPKDITWIKERAVGVDPERKTVLLGDGSQVGYGQLVMTPGIALDWHKVPGLKETIGQHATASNYRFDLAPKTWDLIKDTSRGTAVFSMPSGPIKCAGAPQKIAYLAADHWRKEGVLNNIDIHLVLSTPGMFGIPKFADILRRTAEGYDIQVHLSSEVSAVDGPRRTVTVRNIGDGDDAGREFQIAYDMAHLVPPQSAPGWVKESPLADPDDPNGYIQVDKHTLQHTRYPDVFALGDAGSTPNSKTGAAVRHQAPVAVANMKAGWQGKPLPASYDGYASCPLTLSQRKLLLAEFDYTMQPTPTFRWPDTTEPIIDLGAFKKYGLPTLYWHFMTKGLA